MSNNLTKKMADETWKLREKMDELVKAQVSEEDALEEIMAGDPNRHTTFKVWNERGLWPISDGEREARIGSGMPQDPMDLTSLLYRDENEHILPNALDSTESDVADGLMDSIMASLRVTINAAIMDYHNVQISQMEEQIANLQERIDRLEKHQPGTQPAMGTVEAQSAPLGATPVGSVTGEREPAPVRELVEPPKPRTIFGSREQIVQRSRITAECDSALLEMFENDRAVRGLDCDQMMDFVLYNFFDRPAMSFQLGKHEK
jgi:ribosomal protein S15P/S13E